MSNLFSTNPNKMNSPKNGGGGIDSANLSYFLLKEKIIHLISEIKFILSETSHKIILLEIKYNRHVPKSLQISKADEFSQFKYVKSKNYLGKVVDQKYALNFKKWCGSSKVSEKKYKKFYEILSLSQIYEVAKEELEIILSKFESILIEIEKLENSNDDSYIKTLHWISSRQEQYEDKRILYSKYIKNNIKTIFSSTNEEKSTTFFNVILNIDSIFVYKNIKNYKIGSKYIVKIPNLDDIPEIVKMKCKKFQGSQHSFILEVTPENKDSIPEWLNMSLIEKSSFENELIPTDNLQLDISKYSKENFTIGIFDATSLKLPKELEEFVEHKKCLEMDEESDTTSSHGTFVVVSALVGPQLNNFDDGVGIPKVKYFEIANENTSYPVFLDRVEETIKNEHQDIDLFVITTHAKDTETSELEGVSEYANILDKILEKYPTTQIILASSNNDEDRFQPGRENDMKGLLTPSDAQKPLVVSSVFYSKDNNSIDTATFSRRGFGLFMNTKPDLSYFGGWKLIDQGVEYNGKLTVWSQGGMFLDSGTSYTAPLLSRVFAKWMYENEADIHQTTAHLLNSAFQQTDASYSQNTNSILGHGILPKNFLLNTKDVSISSTVSATARYGSLIINLPNANEIKNIYTTVYSSEKEAPRGGTESIQQSISPTFWTSKSDGTERRIGTTKKDFPSRFSTLELKEVVSKGRAVEIPSGETYNQEISRIIYDGKLKSRFSIGFEKIDENENKLIDFLKIKLTKENKDDSKDEIHNAIIVTTFEYNTNSPNLEEFIEKNEHLILEPTAANVPIRVRNNVPIRVRNIDSDVDVNI